MDVSDMAHGNRHERIRLRAAVVYRFAPELESSLPSWQRSAQSANTGLRKLKAYADFAYCSGFISGVNPARLLQLCDVALQSAALCRSSSVHALYFKAAAAASHFDAGLRYR
jgi:hypothetical protein